MKLSTRARYGLKAMVDLAVEYGNGPLSTASLAARQEISEAYLEQILGSLRRAGLIRAQRGAAGGAMLAKAPEELNGGEILRVLEGGTDLTDCVSSTGSVCSKACVCSARPLWLKLQARINKVLEETSLADMAEDYKIQRERGKNETGLS